MSWITGYKSSVKVSEADLQEARNKKLAEDRLIRAKQRAERKKLLLAAEKAQKEANEALADFLAIDPDLFADTDETPKADIDVEDLLDLEEDKMVNSKVEEILDHLLIQIYLDTLSISNEKSTDLLGNGKDA